MRARVWVHTALNLFRGLAAGLGYGPLGRRRHLRRHCRCKPSKRVHAPPSVAGQGAGRGVRGAGHRSRRGRGSGRGTGPVGSRRERGSRQIQAGARVSSGVWVKGGFRFERFHDLQWPLSPPDVAAPGKAASVGVAESRRAMASLVSCSISRNASSRWKKFMKKY